MSTIDTIPSKISDIAIKPDDTGNAVKQIQTFLNNQPGLKEQQELLKSVGGVDTSLTSSKILGIYEIQTRKAVRDYQNTNKVRMKKLSQASDADIEKEINYGYISYITGLVLLEDMGLKSNVVQEENKKITFDKPTQKLEEILPPPSKIEQVPEAGYYVKTKNPTHRLALRKAPAYVKVSKEASEDEDKKGERVDMMPNGTLLKIIEPHVGYNCEWHQVEVVDPDSKWIWVKEMQKVDKLFCYAEFVQAKDEKNILIPVNCVECTEVISGSERKTHFPDWTKLDECQPFYDEETCKFYITVVSSEEDTSEERIVQQRKIAAVDGVRLLLEFYDKQGSKENVDKLVNAVGGKIIDKRDYYLDNRPGSQLKFLVGVPGKFFRAVPRNPEFLSGVTTLGGILPDNWRTVSFRYGDFKANLEIVTKRFDEYAVEIDNFDGEILDYDIREETKKIRAFPKVFEQFLKYNEVPESDDNKFEIGFSGPCFKLIYVLWQQGETSTPLRISLECFKQTEPVYFERTMGYVFYMLEMANEIKKEKRRWISFLNSYTCPLPRIVMSAPPKKNISIAQKKLNDTPAKTKKEKKLEDEHIATFKEKFISVRNTLTEFVGDPLLSCDNSEIDKIATLDELYDKVLNKISLKSLTSFIASCVMANLSIPDINKIICDMVLKTLPLEQLEKLNSLLANNEFAKVQEKLANISKDPKFANVTPSIKLKTAIIDGASKDAICKAINILDPNLISFQFAKLFPSINIRLFVPPVINLKDLLPTEDTLREIRTLLETAVKQAISAALLTVIKTLFKTLCRLCSARGLPKIDGKHGDVNLRNSLPPDLDLSKFDVPDNIDNFFNDLSSILTPNELCALLNGVASIELLNVVKSLMKRKYPELYSVLDDTSKIKSLFSHLGQFVDPKLCEEIEKGNTEGVPTSLCEERENIKKNLLDGRMSDAQIQEQIDSENERSKELLKALLELTDDGILEKILPPITKNPCDKSGNNTPALRSIIPHDPPSIQKLNDDVINVMYRGIEDAFNSDLNGFLSSLHVSSVTKVNQEENKRLYDLERLSSKELGENNQERERLELFAKLTKASSDVSILPVLKRSLQNINNFFISKGKTFNSLSFKYPIQDEETLALFNDLRNKIQTLTEEEKNKITEQAPLVMNFFNSLPTFVMGRVGDSCPASVDDGNNNIPTEDALTPDTILTYRLHNEVTNQREDNYFFKILDPIFGENNLFTSTTLINENIKSYLSNFNINNNTSHLPSEAFANIINKIWFDVATLESKEKIKSGKKLYNYAKSGLYEEILETLIEKCTQQIAKSDLFSNQILDNVSWKPEKEYAEDCKTAPRTSLLAIEDTIEEVKENYSKETERCPDSLDEIASQMEPMERAGIGGAVSAYIKIETIEQLLRSVFVLAEFKTSDLFSDKTFISYLVKRIKAGIQLKDPEFYKTILRESKNNILARGPSVKDPFDTDEGMNVKSIIDDANPDWVSGESAVEQKIKENVANIASSFEEILQFNKSENIYENFFDNWFWQRDLIDATGGYKDFLVNPLGSATDLIFGGNILNTVLGGGEHAKGNFIVERYVRFCEPLDGKISVGKTGTTYITNGVKFKYGLRLSFLFNADVNFKTNVLDLDVDPLLAQKENSYALKYGKSNAESNEFKPSVKEKHCVTLLAFAEEENDQFRDEVLSGEELENKYIELKKKLINTIEFKTLFEFIFPLRRILSLGTIYTSIGASKEIPNVEFSFENTKRSVKNLIVNLLPSKTWWNKPLAGVTERGGNEGIRDSYNSNVTTGGPPGYAGIVTQAVTVIIKGMAEKMDPYYSLLKKMHDVNPDLPPGGLNLSALLSIWSVSLVPLLGYAPPVTPIGLAALAMPMLSGEKKQEQQNNSVEKEKKLQNCKENK